MLFDLCIVQSNKDNVFATEQKRLMELIHLAAHSSDGDKSGTPTVELKVM